MSCKMDRDMNNMARGNEVGLDTYFDSVRFADKGFGADHVDDSIKINILAHHRQVEACQEATWKIHEQ